MKRIMTLAIFMAVCAIGAQAQLEVDSLGNVGIGTTASNYKLKIESNDTISGVDISSYGTTGMYLTKRSKWGTTLSKGISIFSGNSYGTNYGLYSYAWGGGGTSKTSVGVMGLGGYTETGIGVYGGYSSWTNVTDFAGIYGTVSASGLISFSYSGKYAGYFKGNVRVASGSLYATVLSPSATTGNGNTQGVNVISTDMADGETVTNKLSQVQTIQFMRDKREMGDEEETIEISEEERAQLAAEGIDVDAMQNEKRPDEPTLSAIQYGLAADQLKKVYPELVYEDKDGNVSINYIEMIPLLVQCINELSQKVATLEGGNAVKAKAQTTAIEETVEDIDQVRMDQNKPNPFSGSTVITLNIPESAKQASIYIYDLSGKQIQSLPVTERGETNITVYASGLSAGMYIYTLVVDGQVKVTRKMMVTE